MLLQLFRKDLRLFRYIYLKFGKVEVLSAYTYRSRGFSRALYLKEKAISCTIFVLQIFNKEVARFSR